MANFCKRAFLNPDTGIASIQASIIVDDPDEDDLNEYCRRHIDAELILSDCSRSVNLDFFVSAYCARMTPESFKHLQEDIARKRAKLALLQETITEFATALNEAYDEIDRDAALALAKVNSADAEEAA